MNRKNITRVVLDQIKLRNPSFVYSEKKIEKSTIFDLPKPKSSEFFFFVEEYADGDFEISARLSDSQVSDYYFWTFPFELTVGIPEDEVVESLSKVLNKIIFNKSRIVQRRGLLFCSFELEIWRNGAWEYVYGHSGLRMFFKPPPQTEKIKVFQSPALLPTNGD